MLKFLDIVKTPDGSLALITKMSARDARISYITQNAKNPKVAWWKEDDLEVLGNVYSILAEE